MVHKWHPSFEGGGATLTKIIFLYENFMTKKKGSKNLDYCMTSFMNGPPQKHNNKVTWNHRKNYMHGNFLLSIFLLKYFCKAFFLVYGYAFTQKYWFFATVYCIFMRKNFHKYFITLLTLWTSKNIYVHVKLNSKIFAYFLSKQYF